MMISGSINTLGALDGYMRRCCGRTGHYTVEQVQTSRAGTAYTGRVVCTLEDASHPGSTETVTVAVRDNVTPAAALRVLEQAGQSQ